MAKQPKLTLESSIFGAFFNSVSALIFVWLLAFLFVQYGSLPDQVPVHYNGAGKVDRWGGKAELFILPIIGAVLWISMTILEKYPHSYNYLNLTKDNAKLQYKNGRLMVNVLKNEMLILFSFISFQNVQIASGVAENLGFFFMPITLTVIFGSVLFFTMRMLRN